MSEADGGPFKREEFLDKPGIVGARWWHEGLKASDSVGRRTALRALLVGGGVLAVGVMLARCGKKTVTSVVRRPSLDVQKQYGWDFGGRGKPLTFDGVLTQAFQKDNLTMLSVDVTPKRIDLVPYFVPTLFQSTFATRTDVMPDDTAPFVPVFDALRPIFTTGMDAAYRRGRAVAALFAKNVTDAALVVDLPGPESVAFAAGAAGVFDPVFAIDNWPHPKGVVPAHMTLAAAAYYQPLFAKASQTRDGTAPPMFVLDRARLSTYTDDKTQFDNRHLARVAPASMLHGLGVRRVLYVAPKSTDVPELDDLNDDFVAYANAGVIVKVVGADTFGPDPASPASLPPSPTAAGQSSVTAEGESPYFYGGGALASDAFWSDYPWVYPPHVTARVASIPTLGRDYVPKPRVTPFSGKPKADSFSRTSPPNFATVSMIVVSGSGVVIGSESQPPPSWSSSGGGGYTSNTYYYGSDPYRSGSMYRSTGTWGGG